MTGRVSVSRRHCYSSRMDAEIKSRVTAVLAVQLDQDQGNDARRLLRVCERLHVDGESGCWIWTGYRSKGYGRIGLPGNRTVYVHRVVYEWFVGPIAEGLTLDHLCENKACANPDHVRQATRSENISRSWEIGERDNKNRDKTRCPRGHAYDELNTRYDAKGARKCRTCDRERKVERRKLEPVFLERERARRRSYYHRTKGERLPPTRERTHCPRGHAYDEENTYRTSNGGRGCRECRRLWWRENGAKYRRRKRQTESR